MRYILTLLCLLWSLHAHAATITVNAGGDLQAALNQAAPGDTVILQAGATFTSNFVLPAKPDGPPILVQSSATLPDRRILPETDLALLPFVNSPNADPTLLCLAPGGRWKFDGIRFGSDAHFYDVVVIEGCDQLVFDRVVIIGGPNGQKRGIRANGTNITLTRSHLANIWSQGQDSQAFCAWNGAGPFTLIDNYLEAAGENVMFGGAASTSAANIPADILMERNDLPKQWAWKDFSHPASVKNSFELKSAKRVVIRGNRFERNWTKSQNGYSILFTVRNDDNTAPWSTVEDVLFENNVIIGESGLNILGVDTDHPSERTTRIIVRNNKWTLEKRFVQMGGEIGELTISDNVVDNGALFGLLYHGDVYPASEGAKRPSQFAVAKLTMERNTGKRYEGLGVLGEGAGNDPVLAFANPTTQHLKGHALEYRWADNSLVDGAIPPPPDPPPPTNPCLDDPFRPTVRRWPSTQTGSSTGSWNPQGKRIQSAQFLWNPQRFVATDDRQCTVTITRQP